MRAVIYARVSSGLQADLGTSIPSQIKICKEYAEKNNFKIVKIYTDEGKSARSDERAAFQEMIEDAKKNPPTFETILIYNQSRFSRNVLDALTYKNLLKNYGVNVVSVTEPFDEESIGFKKEGIQREGYFHNGKYSDFIMMSLLEDEYRK